MKKLEIFPTEELQATDKYYVSIAVKLEANDLAADKERTKLKNYLSEARKKVEALEDSDEKSALLSNIELAEKDSAVLTANKGGLILYITADEIYYYHVGVEIQEFVSVDKEPNLKPLYEATQYTNHYQVLVLNRESFRLFRGNTQRVWEIRIDDEDAPVTLEIALGTEKTGTDQSSSYATGGGGTSFFSHNDISQEKDIDRDSYFRQVDEYVYENYSLENKLPVVVYALPDNQSAFREITKNKYVIEDRIDKSGANNSDQTIEANILAGQKEYVKKEQTALLVRLEETSPEFKITDQLDDLAATAGQGRIEELVVNKNAKIEGHINDQSRYEEGDGNYIDQLVNLVSKNRGKVYFIDNDDMPGNGNFIAKLRY